MVALSSTLVGETVTPRDECGQRFHTIQSTWSHVPAVKPNQNQGVPTRTRTPRFVDASVYTPVPQFVNVFEYLRSLKYKILRI